MPAPRNKNKYAPTKWATELLIDLECPSGQMCQVRRPGVTGLIKAGILDSLDSLTGLVQTEHIDRAQGKTVTPEQMKALLSDKEKLMQALDLSDKVVMHVVVQPKLEPAPDDDNDRAPGVVYIDMVDLTDKMFIFQFSVGGVSDLETFRKEFGETLGSMEAVQGVRDPSI